MERSIYTPPSAEALSKPYFRRRERSYRPAVELPMFQRDCQEFAEWLAELVDYGARRDYVSVFEPFEEGRIRRYIRQLPLLEGVREASYEVTRDVKYHEDDLPIFKKSFILIADVVRPEPTDQSIVYCINQQSAPELRQALSSPSHEPIADASQFTQYDLKEFSDEVHTIQNLM
jgi:hypothetical protein